MYKYYGILGALFLITSYILGIFDVMIYNPLFTGIVKVYLNIIGLGIFFDALCFKLTNSSLFYGLKKASRWFYLFLGIAVLALISEIFGSYILELWAWGAGLQGEFINLKEFLRPFSFEHTIITIVFIVLYYFFMFLALSTGFRIAYHFVKRSANLKILGILLSVILISLLLIIMIKSYFFLQSKEIILTSIFLGLWLLFEYVESRRSRGGFLKNILESDFKPLISLFISAFAVGVIVESITLFVPAWTYQNLPWHNIQIFNAPLSFFLIWWLPISIVFLSFYRAFIETGGKDKLF